LHVGKLKTGEMHNHNGFRAIARCVLQTFRLVSMFFNSMFASVVYPILPQIKPAQHNKDAQFADATNGVWVVQRYHLK